MNDKRENRKKTEKMWMAALIFVCVLMLASVSVAAVQAVAKKKTVKNVQDVAVMQEADTEQEQAKEIYKDYVLKIPEIVDETETEETETESYKPEEETETEETEAETEETEEETETEQEEDHVPSNPEELLAQMTLEEKAAQMFMITPEALTGYNGVTSAEEITREALENYPVGGLIYFAGNFVNPEQTREMTKNVQEFAMEISNVPLFLATDEEGGQVTRIAGNAAFEVEQVSDMATIGATEDIKEAYQAGKTIGRYLNDLGINVDFAPVADVLTNSHNQVIGNRSFGSQPQMVSLMDLSMMEGLQEEGVKACIKHFPGHGGTTGDTHDGSVSVDKTLEELTVTELLPFQSCIDSGVPLVMVSHIALPNVTGDDLPASLSKSIITDILRDDMGFRGIVITDAMNMGAITSNYDSAKAAVMAIQAGADMVLMPEDFKSAYQGVLDAVADGTLTEKRIDEAVKRILELKFKME